MLERRKCLKIIFDEIKNEKAVVITTTGLIGREAVELVGCSKHFYMAGSMGLVSSIGLGIAICRPDVKVICVEGDGSFLMNLGCIATNGSNKPKNLVHIIFDNGVYYSTGGMRTYSRNINIEKIVKEAGYERVYSVNTYEKLRRYLRNTLKSDKLTFIRVFVEPKGKRKLPRPKDLSVFHYSIRNQLKKWENEKAK